MSEWAFIWAAYGITWTVLGAYLALGSARLRQAERRRREVESRDGGVA